MKLWHITLQVLQLKKLAQQQIQMPIIEDRVPPKCAANLMRIGLKISNSLKVDLHDLVTIL